MRKSYSVDEQLEELADFIDTVAMVGDYLSGKEIYTKPVDREVYERELMDAGGWQCKCGIVNASYVGSCRCGGTKQTDSVPYRYKDIFKKDPEPPAPKRGWICMCGKKNSNYFSCCACGGVKSDGTPYGEERPSKQPAPKPALEEKVETPKVFEEIVETSEPAEEIVATPSPLEELQEKRANKKFANPFHDEEEKEWKCSRCGAIKPSFIPICECGMSKRDNG